MAFFNFGGPKHFWKRKSNFSRGKKSVFGGTVASQEEIDALSAKIKKQEKRDAEKAEYELVEAFKEL